MIQAIDRVLAGIALAAIRCYQMVFSPLKRFFQVAESPCRYHPTCSQYARECFQTHPFLKALYLTTKRILRCHPFSKGGYDPVPAPIKKQKAECRKQ